MMSLQAQTGKFEERERQRLTQNVVSTDDVRGDVNKKDVVIFDNGGTVRKQTTLLVHWLAHIFPISADTYNKKRKIFNILQETREDYDSIDQWICVKVARQIDVNINKSYCRTTQPVVIG